MRLAESAGLVNCKFKHSSWEFKVLDKKNSLKQGVLKDFMLFICIRAYNSRVPQASAH